jgi:hypothetical protein
VTGKGARGVQSPRAVERRPPEKWHRLDFHLQSFIIKIWLEETAEEAGRAVWRGHITHVPSGERRSLKNLQEILAFMAPYLEGMGVELGMLWRVRQWLNRWKRPWNEQR